MKDEDEAWWKRPVGDPERGLFVHLMTTSEPLRVGIRRGLENVVWIDIDEVEPLRQVLAKVTADLVPLAAERRAGGPQGSGMAEASPRLTYHDERCPVCGTMKLWESPAKPGVVWCRSCSYVSHRNCGDT